MLDSGRIKFGVGIRDPALPLPQTGIETVGIGMQARGLELRSARAARLPQIDLLAQYWLFAKFNNYDEFFQRFDYNFCRVVS